jgi:hypothetical protein
MGIRPFNIQIEIYRFMLDIEQLLPLVLTKEDIIGLSSDMVVLEDGEEENDLLDQDARAFLQFYSHGYKVYPYAKLNSSEKKRKFTVAGIVSDEPRTGTYTRQNGEPGRFMAVPLMDSTGHVDLMVWSETEIDSLQMANIKKDDILVLIGVKFNSGKQGDHITLAQPHLIKINPVGFTKEHFAVNEQEFLLLSEIEDNVGKVVDVKGILVEKGRLISFTRKDGSQGKVIHIKVFDSTSTAPVTLWDQFAEKVADTSISAELILRKMRIKGEENGVVLHSTNSTEIEP